ncbi:MAG: hypothetical protein A3J76_00860, partial [Candidatus Moranbacteria bacterium RBG_13_45_13]
NKIKYLVLLKTPRKPEAPEYWGFPQGHIEKGEMWEDTLRREIREETGINDLRPIPEIYSWVKYFYRAVGKEAKKRKKKKVGLNVFKVATFYLAETKMKRIKLSHEHIDYKWMEYQKAMKRITFEGTRKVLRKAHKYLVSSI